MAKEWKHRKKYKIVSKEVEHNQKRIRFNLTRLAKREALFTVISIMAITIITLSSAYAVFSSVQKAEEYNTIKTGTFEITFKDTENGMGNIINLNGAFPSSDSEGLATNPYQFEIKNTGSIAAKYKIKILDDEDMIQEDNCQDKLLPKDKIKYSIDGGAPKLLSETETSGYEILDGLLDSEESKIHSVQIWIDESAGNEVLGNHYHGKIVVEAVNYQLGMLATTNASSTSSFYAYRTMITEINFNNTIDIPSDGSVIEQWDVSKSGDGTLIAYITSDGINGYHLYIQTDGEIYANQNSSYLFDGFTNLTTIHGLSNLNTSKVTNMSFMFRGCSSLTNLDLTSFVTSNVTDMSSMFANCSLLTEIKVSSNWNMATNVVNMFYNCGTSTLTYL